MCRIDDCDGSEVNRSKDVTARKAHRCDECRRTIQPGEKYLYSFMVMEGEGMSFHTCPHCLVAAEWLIINCGGWVTEQVREELVEHAEEYPQAADSLRPLIDGMKAGWIIDGALMPLPVCPPAFAVAHQ